MDINKLYDNKLKLLNKVLELTSNVKFTEDLDSNVNKYTALYKKRADIFQEIYKIDDEIRKLFPNEHIANDEIKNVSTQIVEIDKKIDGLKETFKDNLVDRVKGYKHSRKAREKFSPYAKNDYSTFESKA